MTACDHRLRVGEAGLGAGRHVLGERASRGGVTGGEVGQQLLGLTTEMIEIGASG